MSPTSPRPPARCCWTWRTRTWSEEACAAFGLDAADLPEVVGSAQEIGRTDAFGPSLPVTGLSVDQQAALVGEHCLEPGESKCTYGTGAFLLANAGPRPVVSSGRPRRLGGLAARRRRPPTASTARSMPPAPPSPGCSVGDSCAAPKNSMPSPARSPTAEACAWCRPSAAWAPRGGNPTPSPALTGIGPGTEPAHVVRSTVEGLAAQVTLLARAAAVDLGRPLALLRVDGGLTRSRVLMQMQADLLQVPVEVASSPHATAAGVGALARLGAGAGRTLDDVVRRDEPDARYEPVMGADEAGERLARFERAVARLDPDPPPRRRDRRTGATTSPSSGPAWSAPPSVANWPAIDCAPCCSSAPTMSAPAPRRPTPPLCTPASTRSPEAWSPPSSAAVTSC